MKQCTVSLLIGLLILSACGQGDNGKEKQPRSKSVRLFLTSCETTDSTFCIRDSCLGTDCNIEEMYFTEKGNLIHRVSCVNEEDAAWEIGKYAVTDSGIVCELNKVYMVKLQYDANGSAAATNYNKGRYINLKNKEIFFLWNTTCKNGTYFIPYNEWEREQMDMEEIPPYGKIYFPDKEREQHQLAEIRKVKSFSDL